MLKLINHLKTKPYFFNQLTQYRGTDWMDYTGFSVYNSVVRVWKDKSRQLDVCTWGPFNYNKLTTLHTKNYDFYTHVVFGTIHMSVLYPDEPQFKNFTLYTRDSIHIPQGSECIISTDDHAVILSVSVFK